MALKMCSLGAQGLWKLMLCRMAASKNYGYLEHAGAPIKAERFATFIGQPIAEVVALWDELIKAEVPNVDERGCLYSRRLVRDHAKREKCSDAGKRGGGNPVLLKEEEEKIPRSQEAIDTIIDGASYRAPLEVTYKGQKNLSTNHPTLDDCKAVNSTIGLSAAELEKCFHHYNAQGWKTGGGVALKSLASVISKWKANASNFAKPSKARSPEDKGEFAPQEYKAREY